MALFRHPHLVRGIVHTPHGAFAINRGFADLPEEIGEALGWHRSENSVTTTSPGRETTASVPVTRDRIDVH